MRDASNTISHLVLLVVVVSWIMGCNNSIAESKRDIKGFTTGMTDEEIARHVINQPKLNNYFDYPPIDNKEIARMSYYTPFSNISKLAWATIGERCNIVEDTYYRYKYIGCRLADGQIELHFSENLKPARVQKVSFLFDASSNSFEDNTKSIIEQYRPIKIDRYNLDIGNGLAVTLRGIEKLKKTPSSDIMYMLSIRSKDISDADINEGIRMKKQNSPSIPNL